jgi:glycosyltransferase involved in cell wall biosynthesis
MKILFVSSGNFKGGISSIIINQAKSLTEENCDVDFFAIKGRGIWGYLKNVLPLRRLIKTKKYDIIHAHYSMSGFVAALAGANSLIVSLMGSDVKSEPFFKIFIIIFNMLSWNQIIVKSEDMKKTLALKNIHVIPNGVDFKKFKPIKKSIALANTKWDLSKKHVLFGGNPHQKVKNYNLAKKAFDLLDCSEIDLHYVENIPNDKMIFYHNSADLILLTSSWEGSPNIIKEAMACNVPIVSTDVGDVSKLIEKTEGCYITSYNIRDMASKMNKALIFEKKTTGRIDLNYLRSDIVVHKIINLYNKVISKEN